MDNDDKIKKIIKVIAKQNDVIKKQARLIQKLAQDKGANDIKNEVLAKLVSLFPNNQPITAALELEEGGAPKVVSVTIGKSAGLDQKVAMEKIKSHLGQMVFNGKPLNIAEMAVNFIG